jgi:hypothetical protein
LRTVMPRRRSSRSFSAAFQAIAGAKHRQRRQGAEQLAGSGTVVHLPEALHHLHQDQIPDRDCSWSVGS